jgi:xanthine dehydrogenase accessory factor
MEERIAVATVVARTAPISSHLGDRAVIHADGRMEGFIGGACSREIVRRQGLDALRTGRPRLVRIRPDVARRFEEQDVVTIPMTCVSEGGVDVYVQPDLPKRRLLIAGFTPVSDALAKLAELLDYTVVRFVGEDELNDAQSQPATAALVDSLETYLDELDPHVRAESAAVAASQGHYDETALRGFLKYDMRFVGLLASPKRAAAITHLLSDEGVDADRLTKIHAPVGLAIGARKPAEVAASILAEMIAAAQAPAELSEEPPDPACPHCHADTTKSPA